LFGVGVDLAATALGVWWMWIGLATVIGARVVVAGALERRFSNGKMVECGKCVAGDWQCH
jgi:hypothetical protein